MDRRRFLGQTGGLLLCGTGGLLTGCRGHQHAHVIDDHKADMVGSHGAGAEVYRPLVDEAVSKLLARQPVIQPVAGDPHTYKRRICFVGVENKSAEELCDFKDQLCEMIDNRIVQSGVFEPVSRRYVDVALRELRLRPDELFLPDRQRRLQALLEKQGQPFDYLLFASLTSGTTRSNDSMQRDYLLTLELVDLQTGKPDKECASLRKGYHHSRVGKWKNYGVGK